MKEAINLERYSRELDVEQDELREREIKGRSRQVMHAIKEIENMISGTEKGFASTKEEIKAL